MEKTNYYLAIDTAFEHGRVVVFSSDKVHFDCLLDHKTSQSTRVFAAINDACLKVDQNISAVFVGLGPGSFIGLRIALATGLGFAFGRGLPLLGFCSQRALAYTHSDEASELALIMKASGELVYYTRYQKEHEMIRVIHDTQVVEKTHALLDSSDEAVTVISNLPLNEHMNLSLGPSAKGIARACQEKIEAGIVDESSFITPNYVKEPNVSLPKKSPIIAALAGSTGQELAYSKFVS